MKLTKRKDYTGSIRTVWNDAKTVRIGLIGTVRDFLDAGLFDRCDAPDDRWAFIPALEDGQPGEAQFYYTREAALAAIAALNIPATLGGILTLNFLLGRLEAHRAQVHRAAAADAGPGRNAAGHGR